MTNVQRDASQSKHQSKDARCEPITAENGHSGNCGNVPFCLLRVPRNGGQILDIIQRTLIHQLSTCFGTSPSGLHFVVTTATLSADFPQSTDLAFCAVNSAYSVSGSDSIPAEASPHPPHPRPRCSSDQVQVSCTYLTYLPTSLCPMAKPLTMTIVFRRYRRRITYVQANPNQSLPF